MMRALAVGFILTCILSASSASGVLWLKMINFNNPDGRRFNGHRCDGFLFRSDCDHRFTICIDTPYGSNNIQNCRYGRRLTRRIPNRNTIVFGSYVGGIRNPMTFPFATWPGQVKIKVEIWDFDPSNADDYVGFLYKIYSAVPTYSSAYGQSVTLQRRTQLELQVKVYCDLNFYGSSCSTYCRQRNDRYGHYICHWKTGAKMCMQGWMGSSCHIRNFCATAPCKNNGMCVNLQNGFLCTCTEKFTGRTCTNKVKVTTETSTNVLSVERSRQQNQSLNLNGDHLIETDKDTKKTNQQSDKLKVHLGEKHEEPTTVDSSILEATMPHDDKHETYIHTPDTSIMTEKYTEHPTFAITTHKEARKDYDTIIVSTCVSGGVILVSACAICICFLRKRNANNSNRKSEREDSHIYTEIHQFDSLKLFPVSSSHRRSENVYEIPGTTSKKNTNALISKQDVTIRDKGKQNRESEKYDDFIDIKRS